MKYNSKTILWISRIIKLVCILFLLMDSIMKIIKSAPSVEGSVQLGWPEDQIQNIGIILFLITLLYLFPGTSVLGAIVLTGYLGGAVAIMMRSNINGHPFFFPIIFGIFIWLSIFLQDENIRKLIPIRKKD